MQLYKPLSYIFYLVTILELPVEDIMDSVLGPSSAEEVQNSKDSSDDSKGDQVEDNGSSDNKTFEDAGVP